ncbi:hypothetical protein L226DRAFT_8790 [Lentinus tigrinus ALCF2SS1-7]|uniref:uncharacterized protein n=1 Tax=Lentinus tigrinus ALCF2SS1-7 TaxID=1328758 RepID=UPI001166156A|nr:hypothetical protein L226DRAFT_8790 [Lentinus tigrinus ALCF2SS1-7]
MMHDAGRAVAVRQVWPSARSSACVRRRAADVVPKSDVRAGPSQRRAMFKSKPEKCSVGGRARQRESRCLSLSRATCEQPSCDLQLCRHVQRSTACFCRELACANSRTR